MNTDLQHIYPFSAGLLPPEIDCSPATNLPRFLRERPELCGDTPFLANLAELELAAYRLAERPPPLPTRMRELTVRPGVELLEVDWTGLVEILQGRKTEVRPGKELILLVPPTDIRPLRISTPTNQQLLALKIAVERLDHRSVAEAAAVAIGVIDRIVAQAIREGLLLAPPSTISRSPTFSAASENCRSRLRAEAFTLQWHITQSCDLHCRHCYDRSDRAAVTSEQGVRVLDQFHAFCRDNHVAGQVSFTGGNPLLHPRFEQLYRQAAERGLMTALLGNPASRSKLEELIAIQVPEFYQVSLEGLREHNDHIRGPGHYNRVLEFLALTREMKIYTMVMLTLTRDNMDQVLPLAEELRHRVDLFTFNRLAVMGEGTALASPPVERYEAFLEDYLQAAAANPIMSTKDSLFNIILERKGLPLRGGCAGFGCGAAFNFVSLLPDGEVHACRKLPSLLGNLYYQSLQEIYQSPSAKRYREGSAACRHCRLRVVCRGCPAITSGLQKDIFTDIDPYCFRI